MKLAQYWKAKVSIDLYCASFIQATLIFYGFFKFIFLISLKNNLLTLYFQRL